MNVQLGDLLVAEPVLQLWAAEVASSVLDSPLDPSTVHDERSELRDGELWIVCDLPAVQLHVPRDMWRWRNAN